MKVVFYTKGKPVAKERPRFAGGRVYTPARTLHFEEEIANEYLMAAKKNNGLYEGPVSIHMTVYHKVPVSWPKWRRREALMGEMHVTTKPDLDNVLKSVMDGLAGVAYKSDKQVDYISATREWSIEWGLAVTVEVEE